MSVGGVYVAADVASVQCDWYGGVEHCPVVVSQPVAGVWVCGKRVAFGRCWCCSYVEEVLVCVVKGVCEFGNAGSADREDKYVVGKDARLGMHAKHLADPWSE